MFRQFGRHAERVTGAGQLPLFDGGESAAPARDKKPEGTIEAAGHTRSKRDGKPLDETIPRVDEIIAVLPAGGLTTTPVNGGYGCS
ncbi:MAG: transposase [Treponema sp.]|nr:transposase [Treponema sp.]